MFLYIKKFTASCYNEIGCEDQLQKHPFYWTLKSRLPFFFPRVIKSYLCKILERQMKMPESITDMLHLHWSLEKCTSRSAYMHNRGCPLSQYEMFYLYIKFQNSLNFRIAYSCL